MSSYLSILFVAIAYLTLSTHGAPADAVDGFSSIVKEYHDLLPSEVVEAYQSLTPEEKNSLKDTFKNYKDFKNEKEFINALKEKDASLGAKAEKLYDQLQEKINGLSDEPKHFINKLIKAGRTLHAKHVSGEKIPTVEIQTLLNAQIVAFKVLKPESQAELQKTFPGIAKFLTDDKVKNVIQKLVSNKEN